MGCPQGGLKVFFESKSGVLDALAQGYGVGTPTVRAWLVGAGVPAVVVFCNGA